MALLRNKEVRSAALLMALFCSAGIAAGFIMGTQAGVLALCLSAAFIALFFLFTRKRYKDIAFLCEQIDTVLHQHDVLDINISNEGELSILQSEIHKMTVRLKEQSDVLKKDKLYLSDSMADIAHQLKTPLTSINLIASFLREGGIEPGRRLELSRELESLLQRIDWLITTLLRISKIDTGTVVFKKQPVNVNTMLEKAAEPFLIPLELRGIELIINGEDTVEFTGDLQWTSEAVGNIIKNCMEHSGNRIDINFAQTALFTEIIIEDNGEGFDDDALAHMFERFYQGKNSKSGNFGIGLALCRMVLSLQNATIRAANRAGGGARFVIRFYN